MLTLWGRTNSSNVMKVLWLLDELGLAYQRIDAGMAFGRTGSDAYRAMNPLGLVPTLQDGAFSLFESNSILRYLCRAHAPRTPLYPEPAQARAETEAWMDFQQTALAPPQGALFGAIVRTPPERRDAAAITGATQAAARIWSLLEAKLGRGDYVCGGSLTIADMAYGPSLHRWFAMPIERPQHPHLRAWYERLLQRPAFADHCAQELS